MGGGLMQLVAYGAQDIYLTGNPQITFFKVVYRRHTNFAMECVEQTLSGTSTSTNGGSDVNCTATVSRNGDLVGKMYVTSSTAGITDGADLVKQVDVEIGGQRIDRHYKEWMQVWSELSTPESKAIGVKAMTGCVGTSGGTGVGMVQVPLQFWFNRNPGLALPLIALQYHEVKIKLTLGSASGAAAACKLWADYIYLDTDERRRFAQVSHEYLIEQLQREESASGNSHKLNFNHPVKELIWTSVAANSYATAKLQLNGHDRFAAQEEEYFQLRQPVDHHTAVPAQNLPAKSGVFNRYEQITKTTAAGVGLLADIGEGLHSGTTVTALEFNDVLFGTSGVTAATTGANIAAGGTTETKFIALNGTATGSLVNDSLRVGDLHLVKITPAAATQSAVTTLAHVVALWKGDSDATTGAGIGPIAGGQTVSENDSIPDGEIIIEYDRVVTGPIATADNDQLDITLVGSRNAKTSHLAKKINVYSFALKPEEHQPSGTCNFSRIDNAKLIITGTNQSLTIYAVNYNVLRVMSGMGGLAYSN
tara:strand:+ start:5899 stop:7503 length:1605 start_codon:yes stop_codon:yes gene_type:complete